VKRFASAESCGRELEVEGREEEGEDVPATMPRARFSVEKYIAEPAPVRIADGSVPRQSDRIGDGPETIERMVLTSVRVADPAGGAC